MLNIGERVMSEARIMLLLGTILGSSSMLQAAGKYFDNPKEEAARCYEYFCEEVRHEMDARMLDPRYAAQMANLDLRLENILYHQCNDTTVRYEEDMDAFMMDLLNDAFRSTLKKAELLQDIRTDLENGAKGLVGLPRIGKADEPASSGDCPGARDDYQCLSRKRGDPAGSKGDRLHGGRLLGYGDVDVGIRPHLSMNDPGLSVNVDVEDVRLLGMRFDEGGLKASTKNGGTVGACLKRAMGSIGGLPYSGSASLTVEGLGERDPAIGASVGLTGRLKNGTLKASMGYRDNGPKGDGEMYASIDIVKRI